MNNLNNLIIKEYVSIILYKKPKEVWVSKRINPDKEFYQHWQCPGGHVEATDISALHAAQRELLEETGIKISLQKFEYRRTNHYRRPNEWRIVHCYFVQTNLKPELKEEKEMTEWQLSNIKDVLQNPVIDSLKDAFQKRQKQTQIIIIEGTCGAGKSTLVQMLKEYYESKGKKTEIMNESFIINDPQERIIKYGNNLEKFHKEEITQEQMIQEAVKLQTWIRDKWMEQIYQFTIKENKPDILISDRTLFSTIIFMEVMNWEKIYPDDEMRVTIKNYKYWQFWKREAKVVWWNTSPIESIIRLTSRGRNGEQNTDYYMKLYNAYNRNICDIYLNLEIITTETKLNQEQLKEVLPKLFKV